MCNRISSLLFGVALVATLTNSAVAQYAPAENPAIKAEKRAENAEKAAKTASQKKSNLAPAPPTAPPQTPTAPPTAPRTSTGEFGALFFLLKLAAGVLVLGVTALFFMRRKKTEITQVVPPVPPAPEPATAPPTPPTPPVNPPSPSTPPAPPAVPVITLIAGSLLALFGAAPTAHAGTCNVTAIGKVAGDAKMPILVKGEVGTVECKTNADSIQVMNGTKIVPVTLTKIGGGYRFTLIPTSAAELRVVNGQVTVARLFVTDAYGAWTANLAVQTVRPEINEVRESVLSVKGAQADMWGKIFNSGGLNEKVANHESRLVALESKSTPPPAPVRIDMSAYDAKLAALRADLTVAQAEVAAAKADAAEARKLAERLATAKVRTGMFRSETLAEAAEATVEVEQ